jgi:beta-glucosidase
VRPALPADFLFGVATSALQVEGAVDVDGRGTSIWEVFSAAPGRIADGSTPATAVNHYHRLDEDLDLLADLGVGAYRFSIAWPRIQPTGRGPANPAGLDFYDRLVDGLLARGIQPWATLFHWDLPVELMMAGGWLSRDTAEAFAEYTALVAGRLGDRVGAWMTLNEPLVHMAYGHAMGIDAPGLTLLGGAFAATHHQLLGHARAVDVLRSISSAPVGIVNHHTTVDPASDEDGDIAAAAFYDAYHNGQFAGPVLAGAYPELLEALPGADFGAVADGDLAAISAPLDFYGVNFYHPTTIGAAPDNASIPFTMVDRTDVPHTDFGWPVVPAALTRLLSDLRAAYPELPPVYITENGAAYDDPADGSVHDAGRISYLDEHLDAVAQARIAGVDVRGYFHWTLLDNWEWAEGFSQHFGLVRVEPGSLARTTRDSFGHYRSLIAAIRGGSR